MDLIEQRPGPFQRHPWETSRLATLRRLVQTVPVDPGDTVLDLGCGDGFVLANLFSSFETTLVGIDKNFSDEYLVSLRERHPSIRFARFLDSSLPETYRLVLLLDVLEHVVEDQAFLSSIVAHHLLNGGHIIITVPAYQCLFSDHDRDLSHVRRYDRGQLRGLAQQAGLRVVGQGHFFSSLLPLRWLASNLPRSLLPHRFRVSPPGLSGWNRGRLTTWTIDGALRLENRLLLSARARGWDIPGLSEWMICQKS